jgi:hypothetical protein
VRCLCCCGVCLFEAAIALSCTCGYSINGAPVPVPVPFSCMHAMIILYYGGA